MAVDATTVRIINAFQDQAAEVRRQVLAYVTRVWGSLDAYRDADIDRFVAAVVPVVTGGQLRTAQLTDGYLAAVEAATLGTHPRPMGVDAALVTDAAMRGVPATEVYQRPGRVVWAALGFAITYPEAVGRGLNRALTLASTDLQLAKTHTARQVFRSNPRVVGYRRVLGGGDSCSLCVEASQQRYSSDSLMPLHAGCFCGISPIFGARDPGPVDDAPSEDVTVAVEDHGELGPVLTVKGQNFRGPEDLPD